MSRCRLRSLLTSTVLLGLALGQAELASGSAYKVTPIQVVLSGKTSSALLTLANESPETLRFQLSAFAWSQSASGEMELTPTDEILFFPALLSLAPGEERKVRVGTTASLGASEKTYRIFFEELPPLVTASQPEGGSQVRLLTKMGIPIFLKPSSEVIEGKISDLALARGRLSFQVRNAGNVHLMVQNVRVAGSGAAGQTTFQRDLAGWYVLAGGVRDYEAEIPAADCAKTKSILVEVLTDQKPVRHSISIPAGACDSPG